MSTAENSPLTRPPNMISALLSGFDAITNHLGLLIFPLALDLLLWLGPRLRLDRLINQVLVDLGGSPALAQAENRSILETSLELWAEIAGRLNLVATLRTYPVGVPSLMSERLPTETPFGAITGWEVGDWATFLLLISALLFVGFAVGTLYYICTAQAALGESFDWLATLRTWPWAFIQVIWLALFWAVLAVVLSIPGSLLLSIGMGLGSWAGQLVVLLFVGVLVWIFLPLIFSAHGIFVHGLRTGASVRQGMRLTQLTLPSTGLFFISAYLLSTGLNTLWRVPPEDSWWNIIGLAGHAFITTGLLAASFVYYRDAARWVQYLLAQLRQPPAAG